MSSRETGETKPGSRTDKLADGVPLLVVFLITLMSPIIYDLLNALAAMSGS